jgi:hypothetical protein
VVRKIREYATKASTAMRAEVKNWATTGTKPTVSTNTVINRPFKKKLVVLTTAKMVPCRRTTLVSVF